MTPRGGGDDGPGLGGAGSRLTGVAHGEDLVVAETEHDGGDREGDFWATGAVGGWFTGVSFLAVDGLGAGMKPGGGDKDEGLGAGIKPTTGGRDVGLE